MVGDSRGWAAEPDDVTILRLPAEPDDVTILRLLSEGHTVDSVSRRVRLSERTVRRRLRAMADGVGVGSTMELVVYAVRRGLV